MAKIYTKVKGKWQDNLVDRYRNRTYKSDYFCIESVAHTDSWQEGLDIVSNVQVNRVIITQNDKPTLLPIDRFKWNHVIPAENAVVFSQLTLGAKVMKEELQLLENITTKSISPEGLTILNLKPEDWCSEKEFLETEYKILQELEGVILVEGNEESEEIIEE